jgi:uncharacterized protein YjeT (DUF2065 family)
MTDGLWTALALVLILEGVLPFAAPRLWRVSFARLIQLSDGQLRFIGLLAILAGLVALFADRML